MKLNFLSANYFTNDSGGDSFSLSGEISGTTKKVDLYNDGEDTGRYYKVGGSITGELASIEFKGPPVPASFGTYLRAKANFSAGSVEVSVDFEYDQSKEDEWVGVSGSLAYTQGVSVGGEAVIGGVRFITFMANFPLQVGGTVSRAGDCVQLLPSGSAGPVSGTLTATIKVSRWECTLWSDTYTLMGNSISVDGNPICIYSISNS